MKMGRIIAGSLLPAACLISVSAVPEDVYGKLDVGYAICRSVGNYPVCETLSAVILRREDGLLMAVGV